MQEVCSRFEFARHFESHLARPPLFYMRMQTRRLPMNIPLLLCYAVHVLYSRPIRLSWQKKPCLEGTLWLDVHQEAPENCQGFLQVSSIILKKHCLASIHNIGNAFNPLKQCGRSAFKPLNRHANGEKQSPPKCHCTVVVVLVVLVVGL